MQLTNETNFEAELIQGPVGRDQQGVVVIIKKTLPLFKQEATDYVWPVSLQDLKTDLAEFPFDHHFPISKMDLMVCGWASAPGGIPVREMEVSLKAGSFEYHQAIIGNRTWKTRTLSYQMTDPEPFETMPLILENAFGGEAPMESGPVPCLDNPKGKGFLLKGISPEGVALPNIERPGARIRMPYDQPAPTCMTPYPLSGKLRYASLIQNGKLKPFHGRDSHLYFGQAHPDLMIERLTPGEVIQVEGMHPKMPQEFVVPEPNIVCLLNIDGKESQLTTTLDGICLFTHKNCFGLKYRAAGSFDLEARQDRQVIVKEVNP